MKHLFTFLCCAAVLSWSGCSKDPEDATPTTPRADFSVSAKEVYKGDEVVFQNNSTNAERFEWDFGDGTTSSEENPTHIYTKCGSYGVVLKAWNGETSNKYSTSIRVTSREIEVSTVSAVLTGKQYYASGKFVNGATYKYEFTIQVKATYYGYQSASRWGVQIGTTNLWWDAESDESTMLEIKHYTNDRSSTVSCRAYAVKKGGNTNGDAFGKSISLKLDY